jgi:hypothetical protein
MSDFDEPMVAAPAAKPRRQMSDAQKLALAEGRHRAIEERSRQKAEREARGRDYFDDFPGTPEQRAAGAPQLDDVVGKAVAAATATGGSNAAEIAAVVGATLAALLPALTPTPAAIPGQPKPVPPAIQRQRDEAYEQLLVLIDEIKRGEHPIPVYTLTDDMFTGWSLIEARKTVRGQDGAQTDVYTKIEFDAIPNPSMLPVNGIAKRVHALYMKFIGGQPADLGDQVYDAYRDRPRYPEQPSVFPQRDPRGSAGRARVVEDTPGEEVFAPAVPPMPNAKLSEGQGGGF